MTGTEFVRHVMVVLEVSTAAGLAEKMRWRRGMERTIARWLAGTSEPSFAYTIDMATTAGLLTMKGRPAVGIDRPEEVAARFAALREAQLEALKGQDEILDELRALRTMLGSPTRSGRSVPRQSQ